MGDVQAALAAAFRSADAGSERSQQRQVGPSDLASCLRRAGYRHHGVPPTDDGGEMRQAALGTFIHAGLLPVLAAQLPGSVTELAVEADGLLGHVDLYDEAGRLLLDVKTTSGIALSGYQQRGPRHSHLLQLAFYAELLERNEHPVERVALLYLARDTGEAWVWEGSRAELPGEEAHQRRLDVLLSSSAEELPREERGPGLSVICDGCPFRSACWGPPESWEGKAPQAQLLSAAEAEEVAATLAAYKLAAEAERQAKADKEWHRALLDATPAGAYGGWVLAWGRDSVSRVLDVEEARMRLELHGIDVPLREQKRRGSISVKPVKP